MPTPHISSDDPLDLAEAGVINLTGINWSQSKGYVEILSPAGLYLAAALKATKPLDQVQVDYELLANASLTVALGALINTDYLISAITCACGPDKYPAVSVTAIKPSAPGLVKEYGSAIDLTFAGGFGIVNKFGATSASAFVSSNCSISMQQLEAMHETSGDFLADSIYRYGFKQEVSCEAYGAIVIPVGAHASPNAPASPKETREGWQIYSASFWTYLDPAA